MAAPRGSIIGGKDPESMNYVPPSFRQPGGAGPGAGVLGPVPIPPQATSVANTTVNGAAIAVPRGYISSVQPATQDVPRGRFYVQVQLWDSSALARLIANLWSGYLTNAPQPSYPNRSVETGMVVRVVITHTASGAEITETVIVTVEPDVAPTGPGFIFYETPGEGHGELRTILMTGPAAGADFALQTVPAKTGWRLQEFSGQLISAVAAANRQLEIQADDGANGIWHAIAGHIQTASLTNLYRGSRGIIPLAYTAPPTGLRILIAMPDSLLLPTNRVQFITINIQGADQWSSGYINFEEYALP